MYYVVETPRSLSFFSLCCCSNSVYCNSCFDPRIAGIKCQVCGNAVLIGGGSRNGEAESCQLRQWPVFVCLFIYLIIGW